jgi:hypothetical protein
MNLSELLQLGIDSSLISECICFSSLSEAESFLQSSSKRYIVQSSFTSNTVYCIPIKDPVQLNLASVIVNYCSNERIFIKPLLRQCMLFSSDIVVSYGSHLYSGDKEDISHIQELQKEFPTVQFVEYKVDISLDLTKQKGVQYRPTAYFHNLARFTAVKALKYSGWVYVIDVDEIPDGNLVRDWLQEVTLDENTSYNNANYWYFKDPSNQSIPLEASVVLIHKKHLTEDAIFSDAERNSITSQPGMQNKVFVKDLKGDVMWHHFSWVRTPAQLAHKIKYWAHANDAFRGADVNAILHYIYKDDNVNDIVHNYQYKKVPNIFSISMS